MQKPSIHLSSLLLLFLLFLLTACTSFRNIPHTPESLAEIHLQDFFVEDTLVLSIEGHSVFKDTKLTSDKILGFTRVVLKVSGIGKGRILIERNGNQIQCKQTNPNELKIDILINGEKESFKINLLEGKYIGFSKSPSGGLHLSQSRIFFEYY